jgi:hypothetical protein
VFFEGTCQSAEAISIDGRDPSRPHVQCCCPNQARAATYAPLFLFASRVREVKSDFFALQMRGGFLVADLRTRPKLLGFIAGSAIAKPERSERGRQS